MTTPTPFAHASEAEMSRILDFYAVRWDYEPHTFPILWNLDGDVVESFSPDFYLPDLDLYLEMTTLRQKLVRKKNRKLRRLRELYPDLNIKLFYARDFRALMLKYGKQALTDGLSGSSGQVAAPHDGTGRLAIDIPREPTPAAGCRSPRRPANGAPTRRRRAAGSGTTTVTTGRDHGDHERERLAGMNETANLHADIGQILLTEAEIDAKVRELGARISADYQGRRLTLVSVLKGSLPFMADLMRAIDIPVRIDLMEVSSYGGTATESSGLVRILKDLSASIADEDVLIVEDIIDTGLTLNYLVRYLRGKAPATLRICTLLDKPARRLVEIPVDYTGLHHPRPVRGGLRARLRRDLPQPAVRRGAQAGGLLRGRRRMTLHRRPLGRGRTLAAIAGPIIVLGCVLPWWQVGGTPGHHRPVGERPRGQRDPRVPRRDRGPRAGRAAVRGRRPAARARSLADVRASSRSRAGSGSAGGSSSSP